MKKILPFLILFFPFFVLADATVVPDTSTTADGITITIAGTGDGWWLYNPSGVLCDYDTGSRTTSPSTMGFNLGCEGAVQGVWHIVWSSDYNASYNDGQKPNCVKDPSAYLGTYTDCLNTSSYGATTISHDLTISSGSSAGSGEATSSVDQTQRNLLSSIILFMIGFFGMVWLIRKH